VKKGQAPPSSAEPPPAADAPIEAPPPDLAILSLMGVCLLHVQLTERIVTEVVSSVLQGPEGKTFIEQTERRRRKTLGDFLKELPTHVKIEPDLHDKLWHFLSARNKFIHNLREIPGWDLRTAEGRDVATKFLEDMLSSAAEIGGLFITIRTSAAKTGAEDAPPRQGNEAQAYLEKTYGPDARKVLQGRRKKS
jgi:hypothetical protein